jgi:hypothetical protein
MVQAPSAQCKQAMDSLLIVGNIFSKTKDTHSTMLLRCRVQYRHVPLAELPPGIEFGITYTTGK